MQNQVKNHILMYLFDKGFFYDFFIMFHSMHLCMEYTMFLSDLIMTYKSILKCNVDFLSDFLSKFSLHLCIYSTGFHLMTFKSISACNVKIFICFRYSLSMHFCLYCKDFLSDFSMNCKSISAYNVQIFHLILL